MSHTMTRSEVFDIVWARPLTTLAIEFGVPSAVLKALCDQHEVPTPKAGHWTQVSFGKAPPKPALASVDPHLEIIDIIAKAPAVRALKPPPSPKRSARIPAPPSRESAVSEAPIVEADDRHPDPAIVVALRKALTRSKPDWNGFLRVSEKGLIPMVVGPGSVARMLSWLNGFLTAAEREGYSLDRLGDAVALVVGGERIPFRVDEKPQRTPHTPTAKELAEKAKRAQWGFGSNSDPWPKYDHSPSGLLSVVLEANSYSGLRRTFSDGKTQILEAKAEEILAGFAKHSDLMIENRRKADEARRKAEIATARRERQKAFELREERRGMFISLIAASLAERAKLQSVLNHLEATATEERPAADGIRPWLIRRLAEIDALTAPQFLDLSARSAKIDFDEPRTSAAPPELSWHYPRPIELQFWSIDEANEQARSQTALEWSADAGLLPDPIEPSAQDDG